jgi:hypothetical protein
LKTACGAHEWATKISLFQVADFVRLEEITFSQTGAEKVMNGLFQQPAEGPRAVGGLPPPSRRIIRLNMSESVINGMDFFGFRQTTCTKEKANDSAR